MAWHRDCYVPRSGDCYPVAKLATYEEDELDKLDDAGEERKFKFARNGDNFMVLFQCDLCHFWNIQGRDPGRFPDQDKTLLMGIRQATLDSFWSRAISTVKNNTAGVKRFYNIAIEQLGVAGCLPEMGPFPLSDTWGMYIAVVILQRSLDKGVYRDTIQYETSWKLRSVYSNCWGASVHTLQQGMMAQETTKTFVTKCPTYGLWFKRFVKGLHGRMGDDHRPDTAICSKLMKMLMTRVEVDYLQEENEFVKRFIAQAGFFYEFIFWILL